MKHKRAISISLGPASRDFSYELTLGEERLVLQRIGTDGNLRSCGYLMRHFDGNADAIGLGGINLSYRVGARRYPLPEAQWLSGLARYTPVVDGAGAKSGWEPGVVDLLAPALDWDWRGQRVLILSALDRWQLAETLERAGAQLRIADPLLSLGLPLVSGSLSRFQLLARGALPLLSLLPIRRVYPQPGQVRGGAAQRMRDGLRDWATCIAGDHRFLQRLTPRFSGQLVITSGVGPPEAAHYLASGAGAVVSLNYLEGHGPLAANLAEAALVAVTDGPVIHLPEPLIQHYASRIGLRWAVWTPSNGGMELRLLSATG